MESIIFLLFGGLLGSLLARRLWEHLHRDSIQEFTQNDQQFALMFDGLTAAIENGSVSEGTFTQWLKTVPKRSHHEPNEDEFATLLARREEVKLAMETKHWGRHSVMHFSKMFWHIRIEDLTRLLTPRT